MTHWIVCVLLSGLEAHIYVTRNHNHITSVLLENEITSWGLTSTISTDCLQDTRWPTAAQALDDWLQSRFPPIHASSTAYDEISRSD